MLRLSALILIPFCMSAENPWVEFNFGPFVVDSHSGDRAGREALNSLEQFRYALGQALGKPDLIAPWPMRTVVPGRPGSRASMLLSREGLISDGLSGDTFRDLARIFLDANTSRMPAGIERGLIELYSTLKVDGPHITLGEPPAERSRDWARMHMLATDPRYSGKIRAFLSNLQQTWDLDPAYKNAFERTPAAIEQELDAYLAAGKFGTVTFSGVAVNPDRQFYAKKVPKADTDLMAADLVLPLNPQASAAAYRKLDGVTAKDGVALSTLAPADLAAAVAADSKNPRVWIEHASRVSDPVKARAAYDKAAKLNPKWSAPYWGMAKLETDPRGKAPILKVAAQFEPRNGAYWQALAEAYMAANLFPDAAKAWTNAERNATDEQERARMHQTRLSIEQQRVDYEAAERRRIEEEKQRDLNRIKEESLMRIRQAEAKANMGNSPLDPNKKVERWEDVYKPNAKATGTLERVDCLGEQARLIIRTAASKNLALLVADPAKVTITGKGQLSFTCGPQRPPRKVALEFTDAPDKPHAVAGEVVTIEFQ